MRKLRLESVAYGTLAAVLLAAPGFAQQTETASADRVVVTGRAQSLYRVQELESGKLPVAPLLSTQTVQVIPEQLILDQGARDAGDLYRNLSGVSFFSYAGVTARGFRQEEIFFDGLRGDPYASFAVPQLFNIERVEYLKGPAGMLYGPGAPGGVFNYITKTPSQDFSAQLSLVTGTEARYGGSAEIEGGLGQNVAARAGFFTENRNTPRRNADSDTQIYDASVRFELDRGQITVQGARYDQDLGGNRLRGIPADNLGRFLADRRWNPNEASDFLRLWSNVIQVKADYELTDSLTMDVGLRWNKNEETQNYHEPNGLFDSNGDGIIDSSTRQFRDQERDTETWSFGANAIWSAQFGAVDNRMLIGGDWFTSRARFNSISVTGRNVAAAGLPSPIALLNPVYGATDPTSYRLPAATLTVTDQTRKGVYLLEEATLGDFVAVFGVRQDWFEDENVTGNSGFEDSATTLRAGLVYRVRDDVSIFGQWAESFEPQGIANQDVRAGGPFAPSAGEIWEGGVRTELLNGRIQSSASVYHIVRSNLLQADPRGDVEGDGVNNQIALGEVTSKGVDFDITADITEDWVGTLSYGYNDARITGTAGTTVLSNAVGDRFANAPEHKLGFWTRYQIRPLNLAVAFGGDYVDVRRSIDGQKVRPYVVFDASLIYEVEDWRALLRVDNLFDETYAASGFITRSGHFPGEPRSVFLEVTRRW